MFYFFFFSSRRRHTRFDCDWSSDVCSSDLLEGEDASWMDPARPVHGPRENHGRLRPGTDGVQTGWRGEEDSQIGGAGLDDQPHDGGGRGVGFLSGVRVVVAGGGRVFWGPLGGGPSS